MVSYALIERAIRLDHSVKLPKRFKEYRKKGEKKQRPMPKTRALSYHSDALAMATTLPPTYRAYVYENFGDALQEIKLRSDLVHAQLKPTQVRTKVHSAAVNPADYKFVEIGEAIFPARPTPEAPFRLGFDVAGTVVEVGPSAQDVNVGDYVYGMAYFGTFGTFAEYVVMEADHVAPIPKNMTFNQAAGVPAAALTSYQALVTHGNLRAIRPFPSEVWISSPEVNSMPMSKHERERLLPPLPRPPPSRSTDELPRRRPPKRVTTIRNDIWTVLRYRSSIRHRTGLQRISYLLELCILTLILLNVILAISFSGASNGTNAGVLSKEASDWYETFLLVSTGIFSVEYLLRLWSCVEDDRYTHPVLGRLKWMMQPMSLIDLLALVPFYLEISFEFMVIPSYRGALTLRSLRLLRILSFLRLERSYSALANLRLIFKKKKEELLVVTYLTAVLVLTSSTTIFFIENGAQPTVFSSISVSAWWSVETITSLGYGDIVPKTSAGRLFGAILALWGIILFTIPGAILGSAFIEVMLEKQRQEDEDVFSTAMGVTSEAGGHGQPWSRQASDAESDTPVVRSPTGLTNSQSFRRPSPRVSTALRFEMLNQKIDEMALQQRQLQDQVIDQKQQLDEMKQLMETLIAIARHSERAHSK
ncbi:hypothetical protein Poli38472_009437 [Pythium oligandrum]|uniref:Enoyl reductase (ER) domain-containing protein n=1 Tax=Pythium oligandrum TaxID=41045 RepID=A0A8K1CEG3_PYTOL|nr:hypothetical protein Poli38472_009437 [Pythium oligandrum]|eukprot:TMW61944.1 hypothetical protein Poli38472_009437 [Pythium oligandrum]